MCVCVCVCVCIANTFCASTLALCMIENGHDHGVALYNQICDINFYYASYFPSHMYTTYVISFFYYLESNAEDSHKHSAKARYAGMRHKLTSTFHFAFQ